ncbi:Uma2 family endonuclease [Desulfallas sp. Bu1-1]|jgi:Uma2 family endonuclease|uniref:Uma2 family endonuclease n=1 Tax=Desulfallas sp. Bu1-1 TaxID=2787620 RepID=UPI00189D99C4|nr:Uma2 family endonuclease [Desulfallas sp. Bu1-1]MBF7081973.1 Uma2 family endonuclease [Desulfallas sp. Bu1-1]
MQAEVYNRLYTYDDYLKLNDDNQYELIGGKLILVPAPRLIHQKVARKLLQIIGTFIDDNNLGELYGAPIDVLLTEKDKPQPDIIFISKDRLNVITEKNIQGAPDLVIEILSPSTVSRDRVEKSRLYYTHGVKEYWIVDPDAKIIEIFTPGEKSWNLFQSYSMEDTLVSPLLPGLEIQLKDIFK